jgi:hypothetical protein
VLLLYGIAAIVTIGWHAISHPKTVCACSGGGDPALFMWALSWWPHALAHGLNPFVTYYEWSSTGVNVAQTTAIPTAAIVMFPFTELFGPVVSYNMLSVASPALAAFTAYLLCRRIVGRELPAIAGGYLFGFSSYEFSELLGHLNLTLIFLIPVMVHLSLRRVDREISRRTYLLCMALVLILQIGLSTEMLADSVLFGAVTLLVARMLAPQPQRARITSLALETVGAGLLAAIVVSPFLYYGIFKGIPKGNPALSDVYALDFANLFSPTDVTWLGHTGFAPLWSVFEGGDGSETAGYFGIAILLAFFVWCCNPQGRRALRALLLIVVGVTLLLAFGSHLHVGGQSTIDLPYIWVRETPIFDAVIPSRFTLFTALAISIGLAAWLAQAQGHRIARWLLVLAGAVLIFPNLASPLFGMPIENPRFFSTTLYRQYLKRNETVLMLPFGHNDVSTLWQAEAGFYFYMPEGYVSGEIPPPFEAEPGVIEMFQNTPPSPAVFKAFLRAHRVSHIVVDPHAPGPWPSLLATVGLHSQDVGGVLLYLVRSAPAEVSKSRRVDVIRSNGTTAHRRASIESLRHPDA